MPIFLFFFFFSPSIPSILSVVVFFSLFVRALAFLPLCRSRFPLVVGQGCMHDLRAPNDDTFAE